MCLPLSGEHLSTLITSGNQNVYFDFQLRTLPFLISATPLMEDNGTENREIPTTSKRPVVGSYDELTDSIVFRAASTSVHKLGFFGSTTPHNNRKECQSVKSYLRKDFYIRCLLDYNVHKTCQQALDNCCANVSETIRFFLAADVIIGLLQNQ